MDDPNRYKISTKCMCLQKCGKTLHRYSHIIFIGETFFEVVEYIIIIFSLFNFNKSLYHHPISGYSIDGDAICSNENVVGAQEFADPEKMKDFLKVSDDFCISAIIILMIVLIFFIMEFFNVFLEEFGSHLLEDYKEEVMRRDTKYMEKTSTRHKLTHIAIPILKGLLNMLLVGLFLPIETMNLGDCIELNFSEETVYLLLNFLTFCKWCSISGLGCFAFPVLVGLCQCFTSCCCNKDSDDDGKCSEKVLEICGGLCCCAQLMSCFGFIILCGIVWVISNITNIKNFFFFFFVIIGESLEVIHLLIPYLASGCLSCLRTYSDIVGKQQPSNNSTSGRSRSRKRANQSANSRESERIQELQNQIIQNQKLEQLAQLERLQRMQQLLILQRTNINSFHYPSTGRNNDHDFDYPSQNDVSVEVPLQRMDYTNQQLKTDPRNSQIRQPHGQLGIIPNLPLERPNRLKPLNNRPKFIF